MTASSKWYNLCGSCDNRSGSIGVTMATVSDTSSEAEQVLVELLRQAPTWRKLELMGQLNAMARTLVLSQLRLQHPQATEEELNRRLADRLLGPELAARAYGPLPDSSINKVGNSEF